MDEIDRSTYCVKHLTYHLAQEARIDELFDLILQSAWKQTVSIFDPSIEKYRQDIDIAVNLIEGKLRDHSYRSQKPDLGKLLSRLLILSLIKAKLNQNTTTLHPFVLEAMARLGDVSQAQARAINHPDPVQRVKNLIWVGHGVFESGKADKAFELWEKAHDNLISMSPDFLHQNFEVFGQFVYLIVKSGNIIKAREITREFDRLLYQEVDQAGGVTNTAQTALSNAYAAVGDTANSLEIIEQISGREEQLKALRNLLQIQLVMFGKADEEIGIVARKIWEDINEDDGKLYYLEICACLGNDIEIEALPERERAWVLRSQLLREKCFSTSAEGSKKILSSLLDALTGIEDSKDFLRVSTDLVLGRHRDFYNSEFIDLLPKLKKAFDVEAQNCDPVLLNNLAIVFFTLGDVERSKQCVDLAVNFEYRYDNWDETYVSIEYAKYFGAIKDHSRLNELYAKAKESKDEWQKFEILIGILGSVAGNDPKPLLDEIGNAFEVLSHNQEVFVSHPNVLGPICVWMQKRNNGEQISEFLEISKNILADSGDAADSFAYLALTLATYGYDATAKRFVKESLLILENEVDANTISRVIGTLTRVAIQLKSIDLLDDFLSLADRITVEWLQAEAIFWIAGGEMQLGKEEQARRHFIEALMLSTWEEINDEQINEMMEAASNMAGLFFPNEYIGWISTKVAAIFAWISIQARDYSLWGLQRLAEIISLIPDGFSETRSLCIRLIAEEINSRGRPEEFVVFFVEILKFGRESMEGDIWAAFHACFKLLEKGEYQPFLLDTWDLLKFV